MNWETLWGFRCVGMWCCNGLRPIRLEYFKLLFYCMQSFIMSFQIMFRSETVTTMTVEMFLTSVQSHMSLQTGLLSECLPTDQTHKALFTTLYHTISHKVPSLRERLLKCYTCVWFFTSVNPKWRLNALWGIKRLLHTEYFWGRLACILEC